MARGFVGTADCEVIYEDFSDLGSASTLTGFIVKASDWVYAKIAEFSRTPSAALPDTGTSPNFWVREATALEAVHLAVFRRMAADKEERNGYWDAFRSDALAIIEDFRTGAKKLDPEVKAGERGIGPAEQYGNGTTVVDSAWIESNTLVPFSYYEDDRYSREFFVEIIGTGATLAAHSFRWWTDEYPSGSYAQASVPFSWSFTALSHGVEVRFFPEYIGTYAIGQKWRIRCFPERDAKLKGASSNTTMFMERG